MFFIVLHNVDNQLTGIILGFLNNKNASKNLQNNIEDTASRAQKRQTCLSDYAEMQLILSKDTASRAQKRQTCLSDYAEMQLFLYKNNVTQPHPKRQAIKEIDIKAKYVKDKPIQTNNP